MAVAVCSRWSGLLCEKSCGGKDFSHSPHSCTLPGSAVTLCCGAGGAALLPSSGAGGAGGAGGVALLPVAFGLQSFVRLRAMAMVVNASTALQRRGGWEHGGVLMDARANVQCGVINRWAKQSAWYFLFPEFSCVWCPELVF